MPHSLGNLVTGCPPLMQKPEGKSFQRYANLPYFRSNRSRFIILKGNPEGRAGCGFQALKNPPLGFVWFSLAMQ
jgi:hypothetical protein